MNTPNDVILQKTDRGILGVSVDHSQDPPSDNLSLPSAREPRAAPLDASSAGKPRTSPHFERGHGDTRPVVTWAQDVFGNAVATAVFQGMTDTLVIDSVAASNSPPPLGPCSISPPSRLLPVPIFQRRVDRSRRAGDPAIPRPSRTVKQVGKGVRPRNSTDTLALLKDLSAGVSEWISYQSREDEGTQSPIQTLRSRLGVVPGFRGPVRRSGTQSGFRRKDRVRLSL